MLYLVTLYKPVAELAPQPADAALSSTLPASLPTCPRRSVCWHSAHSDCTSLPAAVAVGVAESADGVADAADCFANETLVDCGAETRGLAGAALVAAVVDYNRDVGDAVVGRSVVAGDGGSPVAERWCGE